jgi:hypothetical protein
MESGIPYDAGDIIFTPGVTYRYDELLGAGGMGFVIRALHRELNDTVVLKFLRPHWVGEMADRFAREARLIRKIKDPNVVTVEHMGVTSDPWQLPFLQMEYLAGRSLGAVREHAGGTFPLSRCLNLAGQIASGLAAIHERGLVHLDIKPSNILLTRPKDETIVKIIDFGITIIEGETTKGEFWGTPSYAAPEQLRREHCTTAVDIFAVGLVTFEALTGAHPYASFAKNAMARANEPAPSLAEYGKFPPALVRLIARTLNLDPRARPHALELANELRKINGALQPINVHDAVTDPGLGGGGEVSPHTEVREVTQADVEHPTDPDVSMPRLMAAMRAAQKRAEILGVEPTELAKHVDANAAPVLANDTTPGAPPLMLDTEPCQPPPVIAFTAPMAQRPRGIVDDVTEPPSDKLPPPVTSARVPYVDPAAPERDDAAPKSPEAPVVERTIPERTPASSTGRKRAESVPSPTRREETVAGLRTWREWAYEYGPVVGALILGAAIVLGAFLFVQHRQRTGGAAPAAASAVSATSSGGRP